MKKALKKEIDWYRTQIRLCRYLRHFTYPYLRTVPSARASVVESASTPTHPHYRNLILQY